MAFALFPKYSATTSIVTNYQLPITNYQLPITNYQLPITNYQLPITNYLLPLQPNPSQSRPDRTLVVIRLAVANMPSICRLTLMFV
jgi:hypothetical protein